LVHKKNISGVFFFFILGREGGQRYGIRRARGAGGGNGDAGAAGG